jgi:hypothetical protein
MYDYLTLIVKELIWRDLSFFPNCDAIYIIYRPRLAGARRIRWNITRSNDISSLRVIIISSITEANSSPNTPRWYINILYQKLKVSKLRT